jgi:multidrug efflux pump subunit AcrB
MMYVQLGRDHEARQPFGINALVGLIALSGILMRNTLILLGQIRHNLKDGAAPFDAVLSAAGAE